MRDEKDLALNQRVLLNHYKTDSGFDKQAYFPCLIFQTVFFTKISAAGSLRMSAQQVRTVFVLQYATNCRTILQHNLA